MYADSKYKASNTAKTEDLGGIFWYVFQLQKPAIKVRIVG
jgi:hypothetical protein